MTPSLDRRNDPARPGPAVAVRQASQRKCRFCDERIGVADRSCPHCGRALIAGRDPVQPRRAAKVTVVGYLGIGLGVLMAVLGLLAVTQASPETAGGPLALIGVGIAVSVVSFLGARRIV